MRLDTALADAVSGLDSVAKRLATVSQNVSNASTPGYVKEVRAVTSVTASGDGLGVRTGVATRVVDTQLQGTVWSQNAQAADSGTRSDALAAVDAASGTPGAGQDLASLVGALRDGFSTLLNDPSNATQQGAVVTAAAALARGVNGVAGAISTARQSAQDGLVVDVAAANTALQTVGTLSAQIVAMRAQGDSTADVEDQRDAAMATAAQLTGAKFLSQADGTMLAVSGGTVLPLDGTAPLAISAGTVAGDTPAAAVPQLTVAGHTLQGPLGGRIGAELSLRDTVLPGLQAGVDGFAQALAGGFATRGLTLFTNAGGTIPAAGTAGFAETIQVNPAVTASPSAVRDGTGGAAGAAGNAAVITALLGTVLATGSGTVAGQAADLVSAHATLAANAASRATTDTAVQTSLQSKLDAGTGVSVDSEMAQMVQLQNSYGANAKIITAVQTMLNQLMDVVQ